MNEQLNNNGITDELLAKYFAGEAAPQEAMEVDDWVARGEENARAFHHLFTAFQKVSAASWRKPDADATWQQLKMLLQPVKNTAVVLRKWWMAAAAVITIAVAGVLYLQNRSVELVMNTAVADSGTVKEIKLSDSSVAVLHAGAKLLYPTTFATDSRKVILTGEAYFEVAAAALAPFEVEGNGVNIRVLGTAFNTFATDSTVVAEVYEGKIQLYNNYGNIVATAGQTGVYHKPTHRFYLLPQVNKNSNAYATMRFYFENESLQTICETLSEAYHKTITFRAPELAALKLSGVFEKQSLEYILEVIAATLNIQYTYEGNNEIVFTQK
ncbi:ferric-dicitrate binding protein FerR (iron transport regulator) [Filimonas zeae]|uniref:Iron dicitrate transporter FecR n=1 Tax=Filimonas zeae TaxID=1737353 RepID=A0A917IYU7_9BACT|nr:FecR domain-containing protein [Filimonas zeae]MDR6339774.1 ferric-dicitrate binding protein FerR (iron transport regulator) [Filimonas zeae]GGH69576.1 iron dicitrate transporter FecR [Filimonas zeae]